MLGTNLRCLDNLNGIWGFDTSNSLQTSSQHEDIPENNDGHMGEGIDPGGAAVQKMGQNDEEDEGGEHALRTIPIIDSINYVYGKSGHYIPFLDAFDIALEMAV